MKRIAAGASILLVLAAVTWLAAAAPRGPITILGNADLTADNGVVAGSGTSEDPYIISGWEISVPGDSVYGVRVENVTAAFVLRGLVVDGAGDLDGAAVRIGFAAGGVIESCTIGGSLNGIEIASSTDITVRNNVLYVNGIGLNVTGESEAEYRHAIDSTNLLNGTPIHYFYGLDGDRIEGLETRHLTVAASRDVTVIGNTVLDGDGIRLAFVTDSSVTANVAGRNSNVPTGHAIQLYESDRNAVTANLVKNTRLAGIQLTLSSDNEITGNYLGVNDTGIRLVGSSGNRIAENELLGCYTAVWLAGGSDDNRIEGNVIVGKVSTDGDRREGIVLDLAAGNRIARNGLTECEIGITLEQQATRNEIVDNSVISGGYGMFVLGSYNDIEGNLVTQQSRGILFPETYGQSTARGNLFAANVLADNGSHLRTNLDSEANQFTQNVFLNARKGGTALILDYGTGNGWTVDGVGNYWGGEIVSDRDGDGYGDAPVVLGAIEDTAPLATIDPAELSVGVLGTLPSETIRIDRADGSSVELDVLVAKSGSQRWVGFRGFPASLLEGFPGILFAFDAEAELRFTMATVPFDLDIAFFDGGGDLVGSTLMSALSEDLYTASGPFQYALELASGRLEELSIGEGARLALPLAD